MNIPNIISLSRILLTPVFALLYVNGRSTQALAVLLICAASDVLDGAIARRFNMVTDLGKALDPGDARSRALAAAGAAPTAGAEPRRRGAVRAAADGQGLRRTLVRQALHGCAVHRYDGFSVSALRTGQRSPGRDGHVRLSHKSVSVSVHGELYPHTQALQGT